MSLFELQVVIAYKSTCDNTASARNRTLQLLIRVSKSLIIKSNKTGPKWLPWGTSDGTAIHREKKF